MHSSLQLGICGDTLLQDATGTISMFVQKNVQKKTNFRSSLAGVLATQGTPGAWPGSPKARPNPQSSINHEH